MKIYSHCKIDSNYSVINTNIIHCLQKKMSVLRVNLGLETDTVTETEKERF